MENKKTIKCPRCKGTKFREVDCGPDSYDDDITYSSEICKKCHLWRDGWTDKWLVDVFSWQEAEDAEEYDLKNPNHIFCKGEK